MSDTAHRWAEEMKDGFEVLKTLRDELKVQVHLAGMDAKARFAELEHRLDSEQLTEREKSLATFVGSGTTLCTEPTHVHSLRDQFFTRSDRCNHARR